MSIDAKNRPTNLEHISAFSDAPIVFVPGFGANGAVFSRLHRAMRQEGLVENRFLYSNNSERESVEDTLKIAKQAGQDNIYMVSHSAGAIGAIQAARIAWEAYGRGEETYALPRKIVLINPAGLRKESSIHARFLKQGIQANLADEEVRDLAKKGQVTEWVFRHPIQAIQQGNTIAETILDDDILFLKGKKVVFEFIGSEDDELFDEAHIRASGERLGIPVTILQGYHTSVLAHPEACAQEIAKVFK